MIKDKTHSYQQMWGLLIRVRVIRERLSATPGHVIGQGPAPGGGVVPCGGGGGGGGGECTFLRYYDFWVKKRVTCWSKK